jgi:hypothetical protein
MADANLDIVVRVRGGQVASSEIKQVGDATKQVGTATEETNKKTSGLTSSLKGLAAGIGVYKAYSFVKGAVTETSNLALATKGLQRLTGLDTTQAVGWVEMAKQRGIASKQLNQGFITLNKSISAAAGGSKASQTAFQSLGLDAASLQAQDAQTRMGMLADSFKALPPGVDKAALAQKLFGRQAQSMLPILSQNSKDLREHVTALGEESGMTGKSMGETMKMVAAQRQWHSTMVALQVAVGTALVPLLTSLTQVITPIAQGFAHLMNTSQGFRIAIVALGAAVITFGAIMAVSMGGIPILAAAITAGVVGIIAGIVTLYNKCQWFRTGVQRAWGAVVASFNWLKQAAVNVFNWIKANWPLLVSILGGPIGAAAAQMVKHWDSIKSAAQSVWNFLKGLGSFISGTFTGAWNAASDAIGKVASAISDVVNAAGKISSLPGKAFSFVTKHLAEGGTMSQGGLAVVGEKGPELVHLPGGSTVTPNSALRGGVGVVGGAGSVVVPVYLDSRQIAYAMADFTADQQASR